MENHRAPEIAELKRLIEEGANSGPSIDAEIVFSRLRAKYAHWRRDARPRADQAGS